MKLRLSLFLLISILLFFGTSGNADEEFSTGTVTVFDNAPEPFVDLDLQSLDHINESSKTPSESQIILITAQINFIDNTSSEVTVTLFYSMNNLDYWNELAFVYNATTDMYVVFLGGFAQNTNIRYYATNYDGFNTVRTPASGYSSITWLADVIPTEKTYSEDVWEPTNDIISASVILSLGLFVVLFIYMILRILSFGGKNRKGML